MRKENFNTKAIKMAAEYFVKELSPAYDYHFKLLKNEEKFYDIKFDFENLSDEEIKIEMELFLENINKRRKEQEKAQNEIKLKQKKLESLKEGLHGKEIKEMDNVIKNMLKIRKIQNF